MKKITAAAGLLIAGGSVALRYIQKHRHDNHSAIGHQKGLKTRVLETGARLLQGSGPVNSIHSYVCGFHFYSGEMDRQVIAHHYCSHLNEDVLQCVIYDSNCENARLIGIEYIISEELFHTLPDDEKPLWHSHRYEIKSGLLVAPGLPEAAEKQLMKKLVTTYGKTWHTWQIDRGDVLPFGVPQLMMGFTGDHQIDPRLVSERDRWIGVSTEQKRMDRESISTHEIAPGADAWQDGFVLQVRPERRTSPVGQPDLQSV